MKIVNICQAWTTSAHNHVTDYIDIDGIVIYLNKEGSKYFDYTEDTHERFSLKRETFSSKEVRIPDKIYKKIISDVKNVDKVKEKFVKTTGSLVKIIQEHYKK